MVFLLGRRYRLRFLSPRHRYKRDRHKQQPPRPKPSYEQAREIAERINTMLAHRFTPLTHGQDQEDESVPPETEDQVQAEEIPLDALGQIIVVNFDAR